MKVASRWWSRGLTCYIALVLAFLFTPSVLIILFSFHSSPSLAFPIQGFTTHWYEVIATRDALQGSFLNSIRVGLSAAATTGVLGTLAAVGLLWVPGRIAAAIGLLSFAPMMLPALFIGLSLMTFFSFAGVQLSLITVTIAHVVMTIPYFVLVARTHIERFDVSLIEGARDLGATPVQAFWRVIMPIIGPTLVGAVMLSFALSFDEFLVTFFVVGNESTLPLMVWSMLRRTIDPSVNAVSTLLLLVSALLVSAGLGVLYGRRRRRRNTG